MKKIYRLRPTMFFLEQLNHMDKEIRLKIRDKLILAKQNPSRNKRIIGHDLFLFRIRYNDRGKEKRIIYLINGLDIVVLCILDRDNEYNDLKAHLRRQGYL